MSLSDEVRGAQNMVRAIRDLAGFATRTEQQAGRQTRGTSEADAGMAGIVDASAGFLLDVDALDVGQLS